MGEFSHDYTQEYRGEILALPTEGGKNKLFSP